MKNESNLVAHARRELAALGMTPTPPLSWLDRQLIRLRLKRRPEFDYNGAIAAGALELVEVFASQGHSGFSADYMRATVHKLFDFEPLGPLTGEDSEWNDLGGGRYQNNRCSRVFKDEDGKAYDIDGKVFDDGGPGLFTNQDSRVYVTFPYTPTTEIVKIER